MKTKADEMTKRARVKARLFWCRPENLEATEALKVRRLFSNLVCSPIATSPAEIPVFVIPADRYDAAVEQVAKGIAGSAGWKPCRDWQAFRHLARAALSALGIRKVSK